MRTKIIIGILVVITFALITYIYCYYVDIQNWSKLKKDIEECNYCSIWIQGKSFTGSLDSEIGAIIKQLVDYYAKKDRVIGPALTYKNTLIGADNTISLYNKGVPENKIITLRHYLTLPNCVLEIPQLGRIDISTEEGQEINKIFEMLYDLVPERI